MNVFTTTATVTGLGIALVLMGQSGGTHLAEARSTVVGPEPAGAAAVLASAWHGPSPGSSVENVDRLAADMLHGVDGATASEVSAATLT